MLRFQPLEFGNISMCVRGCQFLFLRLSYLFLWLWKVNLRHEEVIYEVLGGACYLTQKEAAEAIFKNLGGYGATIS